MTSSRDQVCGTFTIPLRGGQQDDPWKRAYLRPPPIGESIQKTFPLVDFRPQVFCSPLGGVKESWAGSAAFLKDNGFTAVKHATELLTDHHKRDEFDDVNVIETVYYREVQDLIRNLTGAKNAFVTNSIIRQSRLAASDNKQGPVANITDNGKKDVPSKKEGDAKVLSVLSHRKATNTTLHIPTSAGAQPARTPHLDYTPLGARQTIRSWRRDILDAATRSGVIAAEDGICSAHSVKATDTASNSFVDELYNAGGRNGPRYAAYSVWRPLKKVTRDPLAMAPRKSFAKEGDLVLDPYDVRFPGDAGMGGDFTRELEMLKLDKEKEVALADHPEAGPELPSWYYLSGQEPDEVLVVKFFDSASLGAASDESPGVPHGSPHIGDAATGGPRESIEVRVIAFW